MKSRRLLIALLMALLVAFDGRGILQRLTLHSRPRGTLRGTGITVAVQTTTATS